MTNAKVLVVEHERDAGIGFLREHLERKGLSLHTVGPTSSQAVPGSLDGYSGLIVMGGSMGPTEDHIAPMATGDPSAARRGSGARDSDAGHLPGRPAVGDSDRGRGAAGPARARDRAL